MADDAVMNQLNAQLPEGLNIIRCRTIEEGAPSVMAQVQAALYRIVFPSEEGQAGLRLSMTICAKSRFCCKKWEKCADVSSVWKSMLSH